MSSRVYLTPNVLKKRYNHGPDRPRPFGLAVRPEGRRFEPLARNSVASEILLCTRLFV